MKRVQGLLVTLALLVGYAGGYYQFAPAPRQPQVYSTVTLIRYMEIARDSHLSVAESPEQLAGLSEHFDFYTTKGEQMAWVYIYDRVIKALKDP